MSVRKVAVKAAEHVAEKLRAAGADHELTGRALGAAADVADQICHCKPLSEFAAGVREVAERHAGASRAATDAYRTGWDRAFAGRKTARA